MNTAQASAALVLPLASLVACVHHTTEDVPHAVAAVGDRVVVAASADTTTTGGFGCGGGLAPTGTSVLFVSDDGGTKFERIEPDDDRAFAKIVAFSGRFYGLASSYYGTAILASSDGRTWTEVASAEATHYDAHDLVVVSDSLYAPSSTGYLASRDGVTWADHAVTGGWYNPVMAGTSDALVVGTANGTLAVSRAGGEFAQLDMPGMSWISQVVPLGKDVLVTAQTTTNTIARIDLTTRKIVQTVTDAGPVLVTPAGILDHGTGKLAPVTASGIGTFADHGPAFSEGAVDGNRVVLLATDGAAGTTSGPWSVIVSNDGGASFEHAVELPTVTIKD